MACVKEYSTLCIHETVYTLLFLCVFSGGEVFAVLFENWILIAKLVLVGKFRKI